MSNSLFNQPVQQKIPFDGPSVVTPGATGSSRIAGSNKNHLERLLAMDGNAIHSIARTNPTTFTPITMNKPMTPQAAGAKRPGRRLNRQVKNRSKRVTAGFKARK